MQHGRRQRPRRRPRQKRCASSVAKLESDGKETERLRSELASRAAQIDATRTELETAHSAVDQARSDAERLLGRLTSIRAK